MTAAVIAGVVNVPSIVGEKDKGKLRRRLLMTNEDILITPNEIAEAFGYSKDFVMAALRRREIPAHKIGGRWIISRAAFFRWLEDQ